jgi:hypothetical protein
MPQGTSHPQASKKSFVLSDIDGDLVLRLEIELDSVAEFVPRWRGENSPSPRAGKVEGTVEVQDLETWGLLSRKHGFHLGGLIGEWISPLSSELSKSLALDDLGSFEGNLEWLKLHSPICHPPGDIGVA